MSKKMGTTTLSNGKLVKLYKSLDEITDSKEKMQALWVLASAIPVMVSRQGKLITRNSFLEDRVKVLEKLFAGRLDE